MKTLIIILSFVTILLSCTKGSVSNDNSPELINAQYEQCQAFDLETYSGYSFKVSSYSSVSGYLYRITYLIFDADTGMVTGTAVMELPKYDVKSMTYNYRCYPSDY